MIPLLQQTKFPHSALIIIDPPKNTPDIHLTPATISFKADTNLHTLHDIRYRKKYRADDGGSGSGSRKTGKNGKDLILKVPIGTQILEEDNNNNHRWCSQILP